MLITDVYPSKILKASDLHGRSIILMIDFCEMVNFEGENKLVLYFDNYEKGMVVDRVNAKVIAEKFGEETDYWRGQSLEIHPYWVDYE